jgi:hypothetical protein
MERALAIVGVEPLRRRAQQLLQSGIGTRRGPVPDQSERERRLVMFAFADRVAQIREPARDARRRLGFERFERA